MSRDMKDRPIEDLEAANAFRDTLLAKADGDRHGAPLWHGWAVFDAFLAGLDHARLQGTVGWEETKCDQCGKTTMLVMVAPRR